MQTKHPKILQEYPMQNSADYFNWTDVPGFSLLYDPANNSCSIARTYENPELATQIEGRIKSECPQVAHLISRKENRIILQAAQKHGDQGVYISKNGEIAMYFTKEGQGKEHIPKILGLTAFKTLNEPSYTNLYFYRHVSCHLTIGKAINHLSKRFPDNELTQFLTESDRNLWAAFTILRSNVYNMDFKMHILDLLNVNQGYKFGTDESLSLNRMADIRIHEEQLISESSKNYVLKNSENLEKNATFILEAIKKQFLYTPPKPTVGDNTIDTLVKKASADLSHGLKAFYPENYSAHAALEWLMDPTKNSEQKAVILYRVINDQFPLHELHLGSLSLTPDEIGFLQKFKDVEFPTDQIQQRSEVLFEEAENAKNIATLQAKQPALSADAVITQCRQKMSEICRTVTTTDYDKAALKFLEHNAYPPDWKMRLIWALVLNQPPFEKNSFSQALNTLKSGVKWPEEDKDTKLMEDVIEDVRCQVMQEAMKSVQKPVVVEPTPTQIMARVLHSSTISYVNSLKYVGSIDIDSFAAFSILQDASVSDDLKMCILAAMIHKEHGFNNTILQNHLKLSLHHDDFMVIERYKSKPSDDGNIISMRQSINDFKTKLAPPAPVKFVKPDNETLLDTCRKAMRNDLRGKPYSYAANAALYVLEEKEFTQSQKMRVLCIFIEKSPELYMKTEVDKNLSTVLSQALDSNSLTYVKQFNHHPIPELFHKLVVCDIAPQRDVISRAKEFMTGVFSSSHLQINAPDLLQAAFNIITGNVQDVTPSVKNRIILAIADREAPFDKDPIISEKMRWLMVGPYRQALEISRHNPIDQLLIEKEVKSVEANKAKLQAKLDELKAREAERMAKENATFAAEQKAKKAEAEANDQKLREDLLSSLKPAIDIYIKNQLQASNPEPYTIAACKVMTSIDNDMPIRMQTLSLLMNGKQYGFNQELAETLQGLVHLKVGSGSLKTIQNAVHAKEATTLKIIEVMLKTTEVVTPAPISAEEVPPNPQTILQKCLAIMTKEDDDFTRQRPEFITQPAIDALQGNVLPLESKIRLLFAFVMNESPLKRQHDIRFGEALEKGLSKIELDFMKSYADWIQLNELLPVLFQQSAKETETFEQTSRQSQAEPKSRFTNQPESVSRFERDTSVPIPPSPTLVPPPWAFPVNYGVVTPVLPTQVHYLPSLFGTQLPPVGQAYQHSSSIYGQPGYAPSQVYIPPINPSPTATFVTTDLPAQQAAIEAERAMIAAQLKEVEQKKLREEEDIRRARDIEIAIEEMELDQVLSQEFTCLGDALPERTNKMQTSVVDHSIFPAPDKAPPDIENALTKAKLVLKTYLSLPENKNKSHTGIKRAKSYLNMLNSSKMNWKHHALVLHSLLNPESGGVFHNKGTDMFKLLDTGINSHNQRQAIKKAAESLITSEYGGDIKHLKEWENKIIDAANDGKFQNTLDVFTADILYLYNIPQVNPQKNR